MRPYRRTTAGAPLLAVLVVAVLLGACADDDGARSGPPPAGAGPAALRSSAAGPDAAPAQVASTKVRLTRVASFGELVSGVAANRTRRELLVALQSGVVRRIRLLERSGLVVPEVAPDPVLDLRAETVIAGDDGEGGLISIVVSPDDSEFVVNHTALDGAATVTAFPYPDDGAVDRASGRTVLVVPHPYPGHNGGGLAFDADGNLAVAVGDMGQTQTDPVSQDVDSPLGSILLLPSSAVASGTLAASGVTDWRSLVVAKGLRNPFRISYDETLGQLWIGDVGEDRFEEVNVMELPNPSGVANFGWPLVEGTTRWLDGPLPDGVSEPALTLEHSARVCAVIAGPVSRAATLPGLRGAYLFADSCSGDVSAAVITGTELSSPTVVGSIDGSSVTFGVGPDGEVYLGDRDGSVFRLDPADWTAPDVGEAQPVTTTAPPALPSSACGIPEAVAEIGARLVATGPGGQITELVPPLVAALAALPPDLAGDGAVIGAAVQKIQARMSDPLATDASRRALYDEIVEGSGDFATFPGALTRISKRSSTDCR